MLYTLAGTDEPSYTELDAGYAHSLSLPGLDEVRGTYYPDLDALYVGAEGFDPEKISYRSPSFVNEERILEDVDQSREELTVADLVAYVRTDDAVTFQHEFGHYYLSTFSAAYSQPLYTGMEANWHLHSSITHGELSRNALQSLFALEIRNMLYTHRTRPVQEVFAWAAQAVFDDRSAQEALANRISEIDTELSSLGYTFTHPGYNPLIYESREKTAEWEHFRLSYERALLSAAHRIFREIPEQPAFQLIRAAAKTALTASFSLIQSRRDQESSEVYTAAGRTNLEPAATFVSVLTKYLNDIYEFQVLIDDGISMESVTTAIIEVSSTGVRGLESAVEFFEGQLSEEVYEIYGDDVMNKLLAALKRNSLPTLLFIEEPNEGNIGCSLMNAGSQLTIYHSR